ncbi:hypothetical protein RhiirC2_712612 [Rhizophagus irregularis]|uniref:Uncharacterized protein n=1 Tax=Rhizophagus irregularis TaxID=588596 RepID=A0A2N1N6J0_9GLOM|nr:hypothetical protein RhiirC2_712612 [Rhizophagus irregularis]
MTDIEIRICKSQITGKKILQCRPFLIALIANISTEGDSVEWHFIIYTPDGIYSTSGSECQINLTKSAVKENSELLRNNVKRCVKGLFEMESEIDLLRQENARLVAKITGLESEKAELLKQIAEEKAKHEAENAELRSRIEELEKGRIDTTDAIAELKGLIQEINSSMKEKHAPHFSTVTEISANQVRPNNETSLERNEERAVLPDIISLYETACDAEKKAID